jgi:TonB family protein
MSEELSSVRVLLILLVALHLPAVPVQADFRAGLDAYEQGNFSQAFEEWHLLAKRGNADAQFQLGDLYDTGQGISQDPHKAACWYRQSFRWYEKDAESGNDWSQYRLGVHYDKGLGVEEDKEAALHWYRLAAEQGHAISQFQLSYAYVSGEGVDRDFLKAYRWALLAETNGYKGAVALKDQIAGQLTQEELVVAHRLVDGWTPTRPFRDLTPFLEEENLANVEHTKPIDCDSSPIDESSSVALILSESEVTPLPAPQASESQPQSDEGVIMAEDNFWLEIEAHEPAWVIVQSDEDRGSKKEVLLQAGQRMRWTAATQFLLTLGNVGGVEVYLNGEHLRKLGGKGKILRNKVLKPKPAQVPFSDAEKVSGKKQYLTAVRKAIDRRWLFPPVQEGKLEATLKFRVEHTGRISDIVIEQGSGNEHYDSAARRAIQAVNPLPPFSPAMPQPFLDIHYRFKKK